MSGYERDNPKEARAPGGELLKKSLEPSRAQSGSGGIASIFIHRPIATTLVMFAILLFGIVAYKFLPVSDLPQVDFPTIAVNAGLPGASAETMASSVATPLEKQFASIPGLDEMTSSSQQGSTSITLQFALNRSIDAAAQDVQSAIAAAGGQLPPGMPTPPTYRKVNPADSPVLFLGLSSSTMPLSTVDRYAEDVVGQRISMVEGVAEVNVYGSQKYAVRIQLDPLAMAAHDVGIDDVTSAIQSGNVNLPTGTLWGATKAYTVQASGQLNDAAAYRPLIVAFRNGAPVRLGQIGRVLDSVQTDKSESWLNGQPGLLLAIQRQPGTNTIDVVNRIRALLPGFRAVIPPAISLQVEYDRSVTIRESVNDVKFTLLLTIFLVILVIFLFLKNISATIIPSLALPFSIIGTFAVMYLLGYSLDNLSLLALTLCVGFVVDDAIVMLENIVRHMEQGKSALRAALDGSREIGFTIVSMTLSLAAIFIPFLFMGGVLGRLLHEFAVTIGAAILVSGFVSLTLTPMLCSRFLKPHPPAERHGALYNALEGGFQWMYRVYDWGLRLVLRHRVWTMLGAGAVLAATVYLFLLIPTGFLPNEDTDEISASVQAQQGISWDAMKRHMEAVMQVFNRMPESQEVMAFAGGGRGAGNTGNVFDHLKPRAERKYSSDQLIAQLRPQLSKIPGVQVFLQTPPPIRIGGHSTNGLYQVALEGPDPSELYHYAPLLARRLQQIPILTDVNTDIQLQNPTVDVKIDRDKAATLGVTAQQIESALYTAYGERQISLIYAPDDEYYVITELEPQYQRDPSALDDLYLHSSNGNLVPLSAVTTLSQSLGPLTVNHIGQFPAVTISFNLRLGASLGQAVNAIEKAAAGFVPQTISLQFQGSAQVFQQSMTGMGLLLGMAVLVIYIVLGILYESFIHPLTILSGLPAAGFGALVTLWLFHVDLNIYSIVGIIMLVGIVKKNAIMMIDFALDAERGQGLAPERAIYQGALVRFRPIMMTTFCALVGTLPIALGWGAGAESRRPLGLAVVGGLLFSQFLTLFITPVVYVYMDRFQTWLGGTRHPVAVGEPEPALAAGD
ncbi:MAG TPA: efflux RND transporter permease subunit [Terriglobales bacterium]|nr:efflux RND transporter permease subunit [Terriglobales bacterium]